MATDWPATKARRVLAALLRKGYYVARQRGSHRVLKHKTRHSYIFAFHDGVEIGPKALSRIADVTGLTPDDL